MSVTVGLGDALGVLDGFEVGAGVSEDIIGGGVVVGAGSGVVVAG